MSESDLGVNWQEAIASLPFVSKTSSILTGRIKVYPADFIVSEELAYVPSGQGPHLYLRIQKQGLDTQQVTKIIQQIFRVRSVDIGWAGRKDKWALTEQWFSIHLPKFPSPQELHSLLESLEKTDSVKILEVQRHINKIRKGHAKRNHFRILIRDISPEDQERLQDNIRLLSTQSLPNYYGVQRFGLRGENFSKLAKVIQQLQSNSRSRHVHRCSFLGSVLQSMLFNFWLRQRILDGLWGELISGDIMQKKESGGLFVVDRDLLPIEKVRYNNGEIVLTGPIYGSKLMRALDEARKREDEILEKFGVRWEWFDQLKLPGSRRVAQIDLKNNLTFWQDVNGVWVSFSLSGGSYATVVLRELLKRPESSFISSYTFLESEE